MVELPPIYYILIRVVALEHYLNTYIIYIYACVIKSTRTMRAVVTKIPVGTPIGAKLVWHAHNNIMYIRNYVLYIIR